MPGVGSKTIVHPAHTVQACNDLGQNSRAGGPKAAGTTLGWPLGSRGEWVRRLPYYRLSCSIRAFGSPPRGLAFGLPSVTDTAVAVARAQVRPLSRGGGELPTTPLLSQLSLSRPSALRDLAPRGTFEPHLAEGDFHGGLGGGAGRPPAAPALAGGGAGAALVCP